MIRLFHHRAPLSWFELSDFGDFGMNPGGGVLRVSSYTPDKRDASARASNREIATGHRPMFRIQIIDVYDMTLRLPGAMHNLGLVNEREMIIKELRTCADIGV